MLATKQLATAIAHGADIGRVAPTTNIAFELALPLRNSSDLDTLLKRMYDPADSLYGKYITPDDFIARYSPTDVQVSTVKAYATAQGFTVTGVSANKTLVGLSAPSKAIETSFGVEMRWKRTPDGRVFFAPDREPTFPSGIAPNLAGVIGISNVGVGRTFLHRAMPDVGPLSGKYVSYTGNYGLAPADIRKIYNVPSATYGGNGQIVGVFEEGTFTPSDVAQYESFYRLPSPKLTAVSVDGYNTSSPPGSAAVEVTLDVDMFVALAPNISQIRIYENTDQNVNTYNQFTQQLIDTFQAMATDKVRPSVISVSYGLPETGSSASELQAENTQLKQLAAQGQAVFVASGDSGAYADQSNYPDDVPVGSDPATQPYVTSVGGTDLFDSDTINYIAETSWADAQDTSDGNDGTGGGGGISTFWPMPSYQTGSVVPVSDPQGSPVKRNFPDVSLYGDFDTGGYDIFFTDPDYGPGFYGYNGTSASSPLWAALVTDVNAARLAKKQSVLGFANPAIYNLAKGPTYGFDFHDITTGNNLFYNAGVGYDNSTGWGSFNGASLLADLIGPSLPTARSFSPASGPVGTTVTITGTNLLRVLSVLFGGTAATVLQDTATEIVVKVPQFATSGAITITTASGKVVTSGKFTVTIPGLSLPTITSFTPASGPVGTLVTINGTNLEGTMAIYFNGIRASSGQVVSNNQLNAIVPRSATTGPITVVTPIGTAKSSKNFVVAAPGWG
jgi:kumamolisin